MNSNLTYDNILTTFHVLIFITIILTRVFWHGTVTNAQWLNMGTHTFLYQVVYVLLYIFNINTSPSKRCEKLIKIFSFSQRFIGTLLQHPKISIIEKLNKFCHCLHFYAEMFFFFNFFFIFI